MLLPLAASGAIGMDVVGMLVILAAAGIVALVMQRLKLASVPAYLITGAVIGPHALAFVNDPAAVQSISQLAIILLMFGIGLHFDLTALRGSIGRMLLAATFSVILTIAIFWPLARLFVPDWPAALVLAMAFSLSSTAVVMRLLQQMRKMRATSGRFSLAVLVGQDVAVVAMLVAIPLIAKLTGSATTPEATTPAATIDIAATFRFIASAIGAITAIIVVGKYVIPFILGEAARQRSLEVLMVLSTAYGLAAAILTTALGLSPELGAFLSGFMLSATPFRHQLSGQIGPIRDLFIAVFFTTLGMEIVPNVLLEQWHIVILAAALVLVIKAAIIAFATWGAGVTASAAITIGIVLAQGGEFGLVLLQVAANPANALINEQTAGIATAVIVVTLLVTPAMINAAYWLQTKVNLTRTAPWIKHAPVGDVTTAPPPPPPPAKDISKDKDDNAQPEQSKQTQPESKPQKDTIVIAGFGVVGRSVFDAMSKRGADVTIVEMNPSTVKTQRNLGLRTFYGDISNPEILEQVNIADATALVLTMPDEEAIFRACKLARQINPRIFIVVRSSYLSRGMTAASLGANHAVVEEIVTAKEVTAVLDRFFLQRERMRN